MASPPGSSDGGRTRSGGTARRNQDEQTIQPITVRMALAARHNQEDGSYTLSDDRKLHHIKIVGAVRSFVESSSSTLFEIEDGTGLLKVKQWLDDSGTARSMELRQAICKEHIYVKIIGKLQSFNDDFMLLADSIRPLKTANELTHHMLEVVYAGEKTKRQPAMGMGAPMMMGGGLGFQGQSMPLQASASGHSGSPIMDDVLTFFRSRNYPNDDVGPSVASCVEAIRHHSEIDIRRAIEYLCQEGNLYSTTDEEHYKLA